jgi:hypothetical protein
MVNLLEGKQHSLAVGFEHLVCSSVTNAWAVPVLISDPKKDRERPWIKAFADAVLPEPIRLQGNDGVKLVDRSQQAARLCWQRRDIETSKPCQVDIRIGG